jgi:hypothetical protein
MATPDIAHATPITLLIDIRYSLGGASAYYAAKITDVRYQARRFYRYARQSGVEARYYEAYFCPDCVRDPYNFTYDNVNYTNGIFTFNTTCPTCNNRGITYLPAQIIRVFIPTNTQSATQKAEGRIEQEGAMISIPLGIAGIKRLDILEIHDKVWMISNEPTYLYSEKRNTIIGLSCEVRGIRHTLSSY